MSATSRGTLSIIRPFAAWLFLTVVMFQSIPTICFANEQNEQIDKTIPNIQTKCSSLGQPTSSTSSHRYFKTIQETPVRRWFLFAGRTTAALSQKATLIFTRLMTYKNHKAMGPKGSKPGSTMVHRCSQSSWDFETLEILLWYFLICFDTLFWHFLTAHLLLCDSLFCPLLSELEGDAARREPLQPW